MHPHSSFAALSADRDPDHERAPVVGALDAAAVSIPFSLGSVTLVFGHLAPEYLAAGVFATMLALVIIHLVTARSGRPMVYSGRFFEATLLAAMIDQAIDRMPGWGMPNTLGTRMGVLCLIGAGAGIFVGLLYALKAGRFTRYIPAPVFAGFYNSIALTLLISQLNQLNSLATEGTPIAVVVSVAAVAGLAAFAVNRFKPDWPVAAIGLAAGLVLGLGWMAVGYSIPVTVPGNWTLVLPVMLADFPAMFGPGVDVWPAARMLMLDAATLGVMIFTNTTMTSHTLTQEDGQRAPGGGTTLAMVAGMTFGAFMGGVPMPASGPASTAALRTGNLRPKVVLYCSLIAAAVYLSGILGWIPLAAVCGSLLREAWAMADRPSIALGLQWFRRRSLTANAREDLIIVFSVTAIALLMNLVAAVVAGLVMGLGLFAVRNARRPVRRVWTGSEVSSNTARSRADLSLLAAHASEIKVLELEGDLFFGSAEPLEQTVLTVGREAHCVIFDWTRVRHVDSSLATTVSNLERELTLRGRRIIHAGARGEHGHVAEELHHLLPLGRFERDLDYALETAENEIVERYRAQLQAEATTSLDSFALFQGMTPQERNRVQRVMHERFIERGATVFASGDPADELLLVIHGSASVLVTGQGGETMRLAGVRRGATLGEVGFLDRSPRSAAVVAQEDMVVSVLSRPDYDQLCAEEPRIVQQLLSNLTIDVAARLRHTNRLALARSTAR